MWPEQTYVSGTVVGEATVPLQASGTVEAAYLAFARELRRFAALRVRDVDAADDLVQDAFLRLAIEIDAGREPLNPRAWLFRVVHNLIVSNARRSLVARREAVRSRYDEIDDRSPESVVLTRERDRALGAALEVTPAEARIGLALAAHGYSGRQIARHLGRSEGSTRTLLCRARGQVRRELAGRDVGSRVS
jgi:RNA polymerase sigma-70 factor (ECF subfamily)